jgi:hypothetical protein
MVIAFMAQHVWEVGAAVTAVLLVGQGFFYLINGNSAAEAEGMSERVARAIGGLAVIIGLGLGLRPSRLMQNNPVCMAVMAGGGRRE